MFVSFWLFGLGLILFPHKSTQQNLSSYIDGYRSSYEFYPDGNMNLIISAPHGGNVKPTDVPDRSSGGCGRKPNSTAFYCTWNYNDTCVENANPCDLGATRDVLTDEFAQNIANELYKTWGYKPFVVLGVWSRGKVEFNRPIIEGTLQQPESVASFQGYHSFISQTVDQIKQQFGTGLLIDLHGNAYNYTMAGYLLKSKHLSVNDLNTLTVNSSIEPICGSDRNECIRGLSSFGTKLEQKGLGVVYPSFANPKPGNLTYFEGGYITSNYISKINAIQIELPAAISSTRNRTDNAKKYAQVIVEYMSERNILRLNTTGT
ncbi:unnamed protein product [Rotaria sp. Silwood1]|nr:unnamed protein product [Rotaria sp. Silwood1]CAF1628926.1 unnamed protein product [Rotaria sp. Silwood1]CAF3756127.1 unnamed protein product [Rotaria sp. Silwood1]CAF3788457.1 unnamed protein product [Rotaria sp. Silwood1]CAF4847195.1 unnamed protein product [Rotaria sp. Silwood1]